MTRSFEGRKVGLALGAGAARGWAHIGVLRALQEAGISVSCVAGTSAGALVGGAFAAGRLNALEGLARGMDLGMVLKYFSDLTFSRSGLVDGARIVETLDEVLGTVSIEAFPVTFAAVATDLDLAEAVVFTRGSASQAIRASISFPGVFTPVESEGRILVDGGLVNPVPVDIVRAMGAEMVIAVDVNHGRVGDHHRTAKRHRRHERFKQRFQVDERDPSYRVYKSLNSAFERMRVRTRGPIRPQLLDILGDSIKILEAGVTEAQLKACPPDLLIRPEVGTVRFMDFNRAEEAIDEGYRACREALGTLAR